MAKITPSSLITAIQGGFNGDTFQLWKGSIIRRRKVLPVWHSKYTHQRWMGLSSDTAGKFSALCQGQQIAWNCYAESLPTAMTGFNAFMARNCANLYPDIPALCYYETAPESYNPPAIPGTFSASYLSGSDQFCFSWASPSFVTVYVEVYGLPGCGFNNSKNPRPKQVSVIPSSDLCSNYDASIYPDNTILHFQCRSLNRFGEFSPMTNVLSVTVSR